MSHGGATRGMGSLLDMLRSANNESNEIPVENTEMSQNNSNDLDDTMVAVTETLAKICNEITKPAEEPLWKKRKMQTGLTSILSQLRNSSASCSVEEEDSKEDEGDDVPSKVTVDLSKLNRKERRALLQKQREHDTEQTNIQEELPEPTFFEVVYNTFETDETPKKVFSEEDLFSFGAPKFGFDICDNNYVKSVKFSPCGRFLASTSQDRRLRTFCFNQAENSLLLMGTMPQGDCIYDTAWHPCGELLAATSKFHPVHLYDVNGEMKASYRGINQLDELASAISIVFTKDGSTLYAGYKKVIRVWDVQRPGKQMYNVDTFKKKPYPDGQNALISSIATHPDNTTFAVGSYGPYISLYNRKSRFYESLFGGDFKAVTDLKFSANGQLLFSAGRKSNTIICWDMRNPGKILYKLQRNFSTNHKAYFDLDNASRYLFSGTSEGECVVFDLRTGSEERECFQKTQIAKCAIPSLSLHPRLPIAAMCTGERIYPFPCIDNEDEEDMKSYKDIRKNENLENGIYLWQF